MEAITNMISQASKLSTEIQVSFPKGIYQPKNIFIHNKHHNILFIRGLIFIES